MTSSDILRRLIGIKKSKIPLICKKDEKKSDYTECLWLFITFINASIIIFASFGEPNIEKQKILQV